MIQERLQRMGLTEKEARVYLSLIGMGLQPVSVIARQAKLQRSSAYDILNSLKKKGLVSEIIKKDVTYFRCLDPRELLNYLEREKEERLKDLSECQRDISFILPNLLAMENSMSDRPKVTFFEGEKGMRQAYEDTLTASEPIRAYANIDEMHRALPALFPEYYERRGKEKNIPIRAIFPATPGALERIQYNAQENRETRLVSAEEFGFSPELNIYDNKVLITSWREKLSILIESKEIAELHKKVFELVWQNLKPYVPERSRPQSSEVRPSPTRRPRALPRRNG